MTVFYAKSTKYYVQFVKADGIPNFVICNPTTMKRIVAIIALVGLLASCSQYTCPTYSKKDVKKGTENKI